MFPPETFDKKEKLQDVIGYLNNWADVAVVRHKDIQILDEISKYSVFPIINAMTDINHPCEILADLYALSKIRKNFLEDEYLFCGAKGNIGLAWKEASDVMGFKLSQCCKEEYKIQDITWYNDINSAIKGKDVICTDSVSKDLDDFIENQITIDIMKKANVNAILNPCPPFYRSEEVSEEVIASDYFVGYDFKKCLLEIQQAIIIYSISQ